MIEKERLALFGKNHFKTHPYYTKGVEDVSVVPSILVLKEERYHVQIKLIDDYNFFVKVRRGDENHFGMIWRHYKNINGIYTNVYETEGSFNEKDDKPEVVKVNDDVVLINKWESSLLYKMSTCEAVTPNYKRIGNFIEGKNGKVAPVILTIPENSGVFKKSEYSLFSQIDEKGTVKEGFVKDEMNQILCSLSDDKFQEDGVFSPKKMIAILEEELENKKSKKKQSYKLLQKKYFN